MYSFNAEISDDSWTALSMSRQYDTPFADSTSTSLSQPFQPAEADDDKGPASSYTAPLVFRLCDLRVCVPRSADRFLVLYDPQTLGFRRLIPPITSGKVSSSAASLSNPTAGVIETDTTFYSPTQLYSHVLRGLEKIIQSELALIHTFFSVYFSGRILNKSRLTEMLLKVTVPPKI